MNALSHRATRRFPHSPQEIGTARGWVRQVLADWNLSEHAMPLELAVSELVTNAIVHGEGTVGVMLETRDAELRMVVSDQGFGDPVPRDATTAEAGDGGWGLRLVDDLADGWGTLRTDSGTSVWMVRHTGGRSRWRRY